MSSLWNSRGFKGCESPLPIVSVCCLRFSLRPIHSWIIAEPVTPKQYSVYSCTSSESRHGLIVVQTITNFRLPISMPNEYRAITLTES